MNFIKIVCKISKKIKKILRKYLKGLITRVEFYKGGLLSQFTPLVIKRNLSRTGFVPQTISPLISNDNDQITPVFWGFDPHILGHLIRNGSDQTTA